MSCVFAFKHRSKIYIAGDSAISSEDYITTILEPKFWFYDDEMMIGMVGEGRTMQVIRTDLNITRAKAKGQTALDYIIETVVPAFQLVIEQKKAKFDEASALIIFEGHIFEIEESFSVQETRRNWAAIGGGYEFAMGALAATTRMAPQRRIDKVMKIVAENCPSVSLPYTWEVLE